MITGWSWILLSILWVRSIWHYQLIHFVYLHAVTRHRTIFLFGSIGAEVQFSYFPFLQNNKALVETLCRVYKFFKVLPFCDVTSRTRCLRNESEIGVCKTNHDRNKTLSARPTALPSSVERRLNACVRTFHVENRWRLNTINTVKSGENLSKGEAAKASKTKFSEKIIVDFCITVRTCC